MEVVEQTTSGSASLQQGTVHTERGLPALASEYFSVEERDTNYWLRYLRQFAGHVQFFNPSTGQAAGNWSGALGKDQEQLQLLLDYLNGVVYSSESKQIIESMLARPDMALMLSFLDILQHPQEQFAQLTEKHKQFYYRDILGLKQQPARADSCHVVVELHSSTSSLTLRENTGFDAGKDSEGNARSYISVQNNVINQAVVSNVSTVSRFDSMRDIDFNTLPVQQRRENNFLLTHLIDREHGIEFPENGAFTFGESDFGIDSQFSTELQFFPDLGFLVSSSLLWLSEGERVIEVSLMNADLNSGNTPIDSLIAMDELAQLFDIYLSTEDGRVLINGEENALLAQPEQVIVDGFNKGESHKQSPGPGLRISLPTSFSPVALSEEEVIQGFTSPIIYLELRKGRDAVTRYNVLEQLCIDRLALWVDVTGLSQLRMNNQQSNVDVNAPFEPFGTTPRIKSRLYFTHPELLSKPIERANLNIEWLDKPENLQRYYKPYSYYRHFEELIVNGEATTTSNYFLGEGDCSNNNFGLDLSLINREQVFLIDPKSSCLQWPKNRVNIFTKQQLQTNDQDSSTSVQTVDLFNGSSTSNEGSFRSTITIDEDNFSLFSELDYSGLPLNELDPQAWPQWFALELTGNDFGHRDQARVVEYFAFRNIKRVNEVVPPAADDPADTPVENFPPIQVPAPYTPVINKITLNYQASINVHINQAGAGKPNQLQQIHPLGKRHMTAKNTQGLFPLLPRLPDGEITDTLSPNGYLYIGLENMPTPGQINLYFQIDPIDGRNVQDSSKLVWTYLDGDLWEHFDVGRNDARQGRAAIVEDSTNDLLDSGIITFAIPASASKKSAFMGADKVWLRATLGTQADASRALEGVRYSVIRGVFAQGVKVVFKAGNNSAGKNAADHFDAPLPAQTIKALAQVDNRFTSIRQPFASFDGKAPEDENSFAVRSSEQLRHKGRAQTAWDYEHLILSAFPELYLVRAVRETREEFKDDFGLSIVVIPKTHDPEILQPKVPLFLQRKIKAFVEEISPFNALIKIVDPIYEQVFFDIGLRLRPGFDSSAESRAISRLLVRELNPWNEAIDLQESGDQALLAPIRERLRPSEGISVSAVIALLESQSSVDVVTFFRAYRRDEAGNQVDYQADVISPSEKKVILVPAPEHEVVASSSGQVLSDGIGAMEVELDFRIAFNNTNQTTTP